MHISKRIVMLQEDYDFLMELIEAKTKVKNELCEQRRETYEDAEKAQLNISISGKMQEISNLSSIANRAKVIGNFSPCNTISGQSSKATVEVGSMITVENLETGEIKNIVIVDKSYVKGEVIKAMPNAPVAIKTLHQKIGEIVELPFQGRMMEYEITAIM
ncbi:hypothetical protein C0583_00665 [Candidatus Parcubacteria bacterium]|nr:MAG: hypothetical protein C0583_00665 [Candidatus Parcubacteria bacterium]